MAQSAGTITAFMKKKARFGNPAGRKGRVRLVSVVIPILGAVVSWLPVGVGAQGSEAAGQSLSAPCAVCHGVDGNSVASLYPSIAGQHPGYLLAQLRAIRDGVREVPLMAGQLDAMSDGDLADLAAYYASRELQLPGAPDVDLALGERIYRGGLPEKKVAACAACHSPRGTGNSAAGFPRLSGQLAEYTVVALKAYRDGQRQGLATGALMPEVVANLGDREIQALANYIQGLH